MVRSVRTRTDGRTGAAIVATSSIAGIDPTPPSPLYTVTKFAVVGLMRARTVARARRHHRARDLPQRHRHRAAPEHAAVHGAARDHARHARADRRRRRERGHRRPGAHRQLLGRAPVGRRPARVHERSGAAQRAQRGPLMHDLESVDYFFDPDTLQDPYPYYEYAR